MSQFNYLRDPFPDWLQCVAAARIPQAAKAAAIACMAGLTLCACAALVEHERTGAALVYQHAAQDKYAVVEAQLARSRLDADEITNRLSLDHRVREIRSTGYAYARLLDDAALQLPARAWITELNPVDSGADLIGRATDLSTIVNLGKAFDGGRFGIAALERVDRVERPGRRTLFEFSLRLGRI
jgi:hypothetical protein